MLSESEASMSVRGKSANINPPQRQRAASNRIGAVLLALSLLSALGLLHAAFFHRGPAVSATRAVPAAPVATPVIHPAATGLPEGALFLRHPPRETGDLPDMAVLQTGASAR